MRKYLILLPISLLLLLSCRKKNNASAEPANDIVDTSAVTKYKAVFQTDRMALCQEWRKLSCKLFPMDPIYGCIFPKKYNGQLSGLREIKIS